MIKQVVCAQYKPRLHLFRPQCTSPWRWKSRHNRCFVVWMFSLLATSQWRDVLTVFGRRRVVSCVHTPGRRGAAYNKLQSHPPPKSKFRRAPYVASWEKVQVPFLFSWFTLPRPPVWMAAAMGIDSVKTVMSVLKHSRPLLWFVWTQLRYADYLWAQNWLARQKMESCTQNITWPLSVNFVPMIARR